MALADGALAGFRAWAGRDGRVAKRHGRVRSALLGAGCAAVALLIIGLAAIAIMRGTSVEYDDLVRAGQRMLWVYVPFCSAVAVGFLAYFSANLEVQALGTVLVLGPATLARPLIIVGGLVFAAWQTGASVAVLALITATVMLAIEPLLGRYWERKLSGHPFT